MSVVNKTDLFNEMKIRVQFPETLCHTAFQGKKIGQP